MIKLRIMQGARPFSLRKQLAKVNMPSILSWLRKKDDHISKVHLVWLMSELHNENVQLNNISIDKIMLYWESHKTFKTGIYDIGCKSQRVTTLNHCDMLKPKKPRNK